MESELELKYENKFDLLLSLITVSLLAYFISESIVIAGVSSICVLAIYFLIRDRKITFNENGLFLNESIFKRKTLRLNYSQLKQVKITKMYYTNFAGYSLQFFFYINEKEKKVLLLINSKSLIVSLLKILRRKGVNILFSDDLIRDTFNDIN